MLDDNDLFQVSKDYMKFHDLMLHRVFNILLVSSLYDYFTLEKDGILEDKLLSEFQNHDLQFAPRIRHVTNTKKALELLEKQSFSVIMTTLKPIDISIKMFIDQVKRKYPDLPLILLANVTDKIPEKTPSELFNHADEIFVWTGDSGLFFAIAKLLEDKKNVDLDTKYGGVRVIIVVEDSPRYYSLFLPLIYSIILKYNNALIEEGVNVFDKMVRMRSRPKILLARSYEEAIYLFNKYKSNILGVISDISFPQNDVMDNGAGFLLAETIKRSDKNIPVILQSSETDNRDSAEKVGAHFINKNSPRLLKELSGFILNYFGFGDFVFRDENSQEIGRASSMSDFIKNIKTIPEKSLKIHSQYNHFSHWLFAHGEFELAKIIRPFKIEDFDSIEDLRNHLLSMINKTRREHRDGKISNFKVDTFDDNFSFVKLGSGSLGGKGRGIAFLNTLLANQVIKQKFKGVNIVVPKTISIASDYFFDFIRQNKLENVISTSDEETIRKEFIASKLPESLVKNLKIILTILKKPIAVRSSSHFEDSHDQPFAGLYETYMLPNNHEKNKIRLKSLCTAIKTVYASTFSNEAQVYFKNTAFRQEEEKMSIIIQELVGKEYGDYYYPNFAGVAQSFNYYPIGYMKPEDGIASVVLGFGKAVVDGGACLRFSPKYPNVIPQFSTSRDTIKYSQKSFYALNLLSNDFNSDTESDAEQFPLLNISEAEKHGALNPVGSVYSRDDDMFFDGVLRKGIRVVNFANILKNKIFPLSEILIYILDVISKAFGGPVEVEFAVSLSDDQNELSTFNILQARPFLAKYELESTKIESVPREEILSYSTKALGNGKIENISDIVFINPETFDRLKTHEIAKEVGEFNEMLEGENRKYLLIGIGRWGTYEASLGIPVKWAQISSADVIMEASIEGFVVEPSNGTHFFHNITSCKNAYITIGFDKKDDIIDWDWLLSQDAKGEKNFVKHIRLERPLDITVNGHEAKALIKKPKV